MKRMKVVGVVLTALLFTIVAIGSAEARRGYDRQGWRGEGGPCMKWGHMHGLHRLNLTDQQKQEVAAVLKEHRDEIVQSSTAVMEARKDLRAVVMAEDFSETAVREAAGVLAIHHEERAVLSAKIFSELSGVLTSDQKEQMLQARERRGMKMKGRYSPEARASSLDRWIEEHIQ